MKRCLLLLVLALVMPGIGVLSMLLPSAIQAAREAARRDASIENLRQLGEALHNYHDSYDSFPSFDQLDPKKAWDEPNNSRLGSHVGHVSNVSVFPEE